jgi:hypothetical protein
VSNQKNGGPAFPRAGSSGPGAFASPENGMTLRDFFAAKAMQGILTEDRSLELNFIEIASDSYRLADAMIQEREK